MFVTILFCLFQYTIFTTGTNVTNISLAKDVNGTSLLSKVQKVFGKLSLQSLDMEQIDESLSIETYTAIVVCITLSILTTIFFSVIISIVFTDVR